MTYPALFNGDFREILPSLGVKADLICADLPFGITRNPWDIVIPFEEVWEAFGFVSHDRTVFAMNCMQPFTASLLLSQHKWFRQEIIWHKTAPTGHLNANRRLMNGHENILIFSKKTGVFNPQKTTGHRPVNSYTKHQGDGPNYGKTKIGITGGGSTERYPTTVWTVASDKQVSAIHPNQKPVALMERLIVTYSEAGMLVIDPCMGSGSSGVAAINTGRNFIGIEKDVELGYFEAANGRILKNQKQAT